MTLLDAPSTAAGAWSLLETTLPMLIDGELVGSGSTVPIVSPRDKRVVGHVAAAEDAHVEAATRAARRALTEGPWASMTGRERGKRLLALAEIIEAHADELAFLDAVDVGKPVSSVHYSDIPVSLEALSYFAGRAQDLAGRSVDVGVPGVHHRSRLEPQGVVLEVLPWNGPLWTGVQRVAAILAAGNTVLVKPAELGSASWFHLARLARDVFPPGVLNVLGGTGAEVGAKLVVHPEVDLVSHTGGVVTGRRILADTAPLLRRVSLELGGKNPNIVLADADLDAAVRWSAMGAFANSGQVCVCGSRILVQRPVYERFSEALVAAAEAQVVGDPLLPQTQLGPVVGEAQFAKVTGYIERAVAEGQGYLLTGGTPYEDEVRSAGWYVRPTVFADVDPSCAIARDEIFGPVVTLTPFDDVEEALRIANDTSYGLAAGVFTQDLSAAGRIADRLQAGQVYVNQWFSPGGLQAPSQGYKNSGLGGVGIEKYLQVKNVFTRVDQ